MTRKYFMQRIPIEAKPFLLGKQEKITEYVRDITGSKKPKKLSMPRILLTLAKSEVKLEDITLAELAQGRRRRR